VDGAAAALVVYWARLALWLLVLLLVTVLSTLWFLAVSRYLRADGSALASLNLSPSTQSRSARSAAASVRPYPHRHNEQRPQRPVTGSPGGPSGR
jgi:hypothetical protein